VQASRDLGVKTLIDAEHVKINPGIDLLALALMAVFNKEQPLIGHTYQCYLTSTQDRLERHLALASSLGVSFGVKLVRGAYMDSERKRALSAGDPSPVFGTYEETNNNYNRLMFVLSSCRLLRRLMWFVADSERECNLVVASHNEESIQTAISEMRALGLQPDDPRVSFGQLLGMYDQTTFPLALGGYNVYKSIPYGPLTELLPYLARRASENRAVLRSPARERCMLAREIRRRLV
ncbi:proline oxidase, putative, partial [Ixodes scapularis]